MAKKKTETLYRAAKRTVKLAWGGKLWTIDSNYRHYPDGFVQTYAGWLEADQVTDQDNETNTDIEVNNGQ